ncbi:hypothetical protein JD844_024162 [Phrynosoma platyrhinos]|uniref:Uncharacterized protein n=1 Tax=Phrynosoma platyrhinos TaxID=52577 RepID=A0ABQ7SXL9_PHRPL|nr:hypothetical protein JD844_024162 [Phrynosoma platyrhinos]
MTQPKEVEFGECTVTCGIGIREVILTNGCPGGETKCIVRVEECRGPADCGWGKPISESLASVKIPCIFVPPENRFQYVWKMLIPDQTGRSGSLAEAAGDTLFSYPQALCNDLSVLQMKNFADVLLAAVILNFATQSQYQLQGFKGSLKST